MTGSRLLIRLAGVLVPVRHREEWAREWLAELHHAESRGTESAASLLRFARGAFDDALWHRREEWSPERLAVRGRSPAWCLGGIGAVIVSIAMVSGFLPVTRSILMPLPYRDPERIATASDGGAPLATRHAIAADSVRLWQSRSKLIEGAEAYSWKESFAKDSFGWPTRVRRAMVSENFFFLLGARSSEGRVFARDQFTSCGDCVVISYPFWRGALQGKRVTRETEVVLDERRYHVAAVLAPDFWFLSREIQVWTVAPIGSFEGQQTGVVVRLAPEVTPGDGQRELGAVIRKANGGIRGTGLIQLSPVAGRVRSVFGSFGLALVLAIVTAAGSSRLRFCRMNFRGALFFAAKTLLLLAVVFVAGLEFTRAASINMLGGADLLTEPLSTWLSLLACMGVLLWSVRDQQARCRVCLNRLGLRTRVGCPGCLLLDWAGTELVCVEGHGMLHVPEMVSSWSKSDQWTSLDESWQALFDRG
ncbi:MAG TPA: hypothetical protein VGN17_15845 [Bryobacteraceae bacterium]|jgi:hypothetical protein